MEGQGILRPDDRFRSPQGGITQRRARAPLVRKCGKLLSDRGCLGGGDGSLVEEKEIETYKAVLPEYQIVKGKKGIGKQRQAISDYFSTNEFIVSIDDDVEQIYDHGKPIINLDILFKYIVSR